MIAKTLDGTGIYGEILHFAFAALFFGGALLIFIYLWRKGRLDMDEDPARRMLEDEPEDKKRNSNNKEKGNESKR
jgi:hypothetical protein